jgi:hypothetical protein
MQHTARLPQGGGPRVQCPRCHIGWIGSFRRLAVRYDWLVARLEMELTL